MEKGHKQYGINPGPKFPLKVFQTKHDVVGLLVIWINPGPKFPLKAFQMKHDAVGF